MGKDAECNIKKPTLDYCLFFAKYMALGISFKPAGKWK